MSPFGYLCCSCLAGLCCTHSSAYWLHIHVEPPLSFPAARGSCNMTRTKCTHRCSCTHRHTSSCSTPSASSSRRSRAVALVGSHTFTWTTWSRAMVSINHALWTSLGTTSLQSAFLFAHPPLLCQRRLHLLCSQPDLRHRQINPRRDYLV